MPAPADDPPFIEHDDLFGVPDGADPLSDDDDRRSFVF